MFNVGLCGQLSEPALVQARGLHQGWKEADDNPDEEKQCWVEAPLPCDIKRREFYLEQRLGRGRDGENGKAIGGSIGTR